MKHPGYKNALNQYAGRSIKKKLNTSDKKAHSDELAIFAKRLKTLPLKNIEENLDEHLFYDPAIECFFPTKVRKIYSAYTVELAEELLLKIYKSRDALELTKIKINTRESNLKYLYSYDEYVYLFNQNIELNFEERMYMNKHKKHIFKSLVFYRLVKKPNVIKRLLGVFNNDKLYPNF